MKDRDDDVDVDVDVDDMRCSLFVLQNLSCPKSETKRKEHRYIATYLER
jgi:hypothetical protein